MRNIYISSDALCQKNKLWITRSKPSNDLHRYCNVRNNLRALTKILKGDYERNIIPKLSGDSQA